MWVILFTAKLLIIHFTNSYIGQAFTEGCLKKKKKKKNCLDKRALWASWSKGAGAQAPSAPPSARACSAVTVGNSGAVLTGAMV